AVSDFIQGLGFGLILQISVGPVCIAVLHKGLSQGFRHAFAMAWAAALVDAAYIVLSIVGISAVLQIGPVRNLIGLAGALLLVYFGIRYLRAPALATRIEHRGDDSLLKSFTYGAALTLTNPLTILFWAGVLGAMMSTHTFNREGGVVYFAAGCVTATVLFLTAVALAGHFLERVLTPRLSLWLNRVVGLFLIGFAVKLAVDLL
ncbi:MAG: LysE family translocator, partial [Anaerolineae bacterium]